MMLRRMIRWIRIARGSKVFGYSAGTFLYRTAKAGAGDATQPPLQPFPVRIKAAARCYHSYSDRNTIPIILSYIGH